VSHIAYQAFFNKLLKLLLGCRNDRNELMVKWIFMNPTVDPIPSKFNDCIHYRTPIHDCPRYLIVGVP